MQRLDERRGGLGVVGRGDRRHHRAHLGTVEPLEPDLFDRVAALESQDELAARLPSRELVGPVRGDDDQARPRLLGDAVDEVGAGGVDPVEVLDHEQRWALGRRRRDQVEDCAGDLVTRRLGSTRPGHGVERPAHRSGLGSHRDRGDVGRAAIATISRTSRVLPIPASPETKRHRRLLGRHHVGGIDDPRQAGEGASAADHDRAHPDATAQHGLDARGSGHDGDQTS